MRIRLIIGVVFLMVVAVALVAMPRHSGLSKHPNVPWSAQMEICDGARSSVALWDHC